MNIFAARECRTHKPRHSVDIVPLRAVQELGQVEKHRRNLQAAEQLRQVEKHRQQLNSGSQPRQVEKHRRSVLRNSVGTATARQSLLKHPCGPANPSPPEPSRQDTCSQCDPRNCSLRVLVSKRRTVTRCLLQHPGMRLLIKHACQVLDIMLGHVICQL